MKFERYTSFFYDREGLRYDISIWQETNSDKTPDGWPSPITLAADPVTIEWSEVEKLDPVQGSCATLRAVSLSDRQFFDMYSVEYGTIELRVYREPRKGIGSLTPNLIRIDGFNTVKAEYPVSSPITVSAARYNANGVYIGRVSSVMQIGESETTLFAIEGENTLSDLCIDDVNTDGVYRYYVTETILYWAGTLDPELFEEPYAYKDRYITEMSFVDFAPLEYVYWEEKGLMSIRSIIEKCIERGKFLRLPPPLELVSTKTKEGDSALDCVVQAENFYDDDDEPMTLREVLEEVLRPFALRIIQKDGIITIFDLHALSNATTDAIEWYGTDATIEADRVYNDITVKLSPYQDETILDASIDPDEVLKEGDEGVVEGVSKGYSMSGFGSPDGDYTEDYLVKTEMFRYYMKKAPVEYGNIKVKGNAWMFRVDPVYGGSKEGLVLWSRSTSLPNDEWIGGTWPDYGITNEPICAMGDNYNKIYLSVPVTPIIETKGVFVSSDGGESYILIRLEAMYDARYDWFVEANKYSTPIPLNNYDYSGNENYIKNRGHLCYIPVVITIRDAEGNIKYYYSNNGNRVGESIQTAGWLPYDSKIDLYLNPAWLVYYSENKADEKGVMSGWQTNRRLINSAKHEIPLDVAEKNNGEYLPMPPESGYLVVEVCAGHHFSTFASNRITVLENGVRKDDPIFTQKPRTIAYKSIEIKIVPAYGSDDVEAKDIEDIAWINKSARENLEIDTIVGTPNEKMPAARGALRAPCGEQVDSFTRGDHSGRLEKLLIGTAYSQYADRKNVLTGTVDLIHGFAPFSDQSINGIYVLMSEIQNLEKRTSEIRAAEFVGDIYESIEEKEE